MRLTEKTIRELTIAGVAVAALAAGYPWVAFGALVVFVCHMASSQ